MRARSCRAAAKPPITGMETSSRTSSGRRSSACSMPTRPLSASASTSAPRVSAMVRNLWRIASSSSTIIKSKYVRKLPDGLRCSQKKKPVRAQRIMKGGNQLPLQLHSEIDQHVTAANEIHPGKRWIMAQVLARKNAQIADPLCHLVSFFILLKEAPQPLR